MANIVDKENERNKLNEPNQNNGKLLFSFLVRFLFVWFLLNEVRKKDKPFGSTH